MGLRSSGRFFLFLQLSFLFIVCELPHNINPLELSLNVTHDSCSDSAYSFPSISVSASLNDKNFDAKASISYGLYNRDSLRINEMGIWTNIYAGRYTVFAFLHSDDPSFKCPFRMESVDDLPNRFCGATSRSVTVEASYFFLDVANLISPVSCSKFEEGTIVFSIRGGVGPFYAKTSDQFFYLGYSSVLRIVPGSYSFIVYDNFGCSKTVFAVLDFDKKCDEKLYNFWSRGGFEGLITFLISSALIFASIQLLLRSKRKVKNYLDLTLQLQKTEYKLRNARLLRIFEQKLDKEEEDERIRKRKERREKKKKEKIKK